MKAFVTNFTTYLMLLVSLAAICVAVVSSQANRTKSPNPCFSNQQGTMYPIAGRCTSYIFCQEGMPLEVQCPIGQGFSTAARGCTNMDVSKCDGITTTTTRKTTTTATAATTTTKTTGSTRDPTTGSATDTTGSTTADPNSSTTADPNAGTTADATGKPSNGPTDSTTPDPTADPTSTPSSSVTSSTTISEQPNSSTKNPNLTTEKDIDSTTDSLHRTTPRSCLSNEQSAANQAACVGKPFGQLVPYPGECSKYLVCDCEYPTVKQCPGGTWFNGKIQNCDWPQNVSCPWAGSSTTESSSQATQTTESGPTSTDSSTAATQSTGSTQSTQTTNTVSTIITSSTSIDPTASTPTTQSSTGSTGTSDPTLPTAPTVGPTTSTTTNDLTSSSTIASTNTDDTTSEPTISTTTPDFPIGVCRNQPNGQLLPYNGNCANYIYCENGTPSLKSCPPGYNFDVNLLLCNAAEDTVCSSDISTTPITTLYPLGDVCANMSKGESLPYTENCAYYLYCNGESDTPQILPCPYMNWYNPETGNCGPDVSSTACMTTPTTTATSPTTPPTPQELCENQTPGNTIPIPGSCNKYVMCLGGSSVVVLNCPKNNFYNPNSGNCGPDVPAEDCLRSSTTTGAVSSTTTDQSTTTTAANAPHPVCDDATNGEIVPYPDDCRKYVMCVTPAPVAFTCPVNWVFDPHSFECEASSNGSCIVDPNATTSIPPLNVCQGVPVNGTVAYPENCQFYIRCYESTYMLESCSAGQYYDPTTAQCSATSFTDACKTVTTTTSTSVVTPIATTTPNPQTTSSESVSATESTSGGTTQTTLSATDSSSRSTTTSESTSYPTPPTPMPTTSSSAGTTSTEVTTSSSASSPPSSIEATTSIESTTNVTPPTPLPTTSSSESTTSTEITTSSPTSSIEATATTAATSSSSQQTTTEASTIYSTQSTTQSTTTTTTAATTTTTAGPPSCNGVSDGTSFPDPSNCQQYYVCSNGSPIIILCFPNEYYQPQLQMCTSSASQTACQGPATTTTVTTTSTATVVPTTSTTTSAPTITTTPSTTSTTESELNNPCEHSADGATQPYPGESCSLYIVCWNRSPVFVHCPHSYYYDNLTGRCSIDVPSTNCHQPTPPTTTSQSPTGPTQFPPTTSTQSTGPTKAPTTLCTSQPDGTTLSDPGNCTQYIVCVNGVETYKPCAANTYYDPDSGKCDAITASTACKELPPTTINPNSTPSMTSENSTPSTLETTDSTNTTITATTPPLTNITTESTTSITKPAVSNPCSTAADGTNEPYPGGSCSTYILCWNREPVFVHCPSDHYYDNESGHCSAAVSSTACQQATTITTAPTPTGPTLFPPSTSTMGPTTAPTTLCSYQPDGTKLSDPNDCTKYMECEGGQETFMPCPANTYYNPNDGQCNAITASSACKGLPITTTTSSSSVTSSSAETSSEMTTFTTDTTTATSRVSSELTTLTTETTSPITVPTSSVSSSTSTEATLTTNTPEITNPCSGSPDGTSEPYPGGSCSIYILCWNHASVFVHCPSENFYDADTGRCSSAVSSTACQQAATITTSQTPTGPTLFPPTTSTQSTGPTTAPTTLCTLQPDGTKLSDPSDCTKYMKCEGGKETFVPCTTGSYYNPNNGQCDAITSSTACKGLPVTTAITPPTSTTPTPTTTTTETTTMAPPDYLCTDQPNGTTVSYPADCTRYVLCENQRASYEFCATGTYYNPTNGRCSASTPPTACQVPVMPTTTPVTPGKENVCCGKPLGTQLAYPNDNQKYIVCQYPVPSTLECPAGTIFDVELGKCMPPDNNNEKPTTLDPPPITPFTSDPLNTPPITADPPLDSTQDTPADPTQPISPTDASSTVVYPPNNPITICMGMVSGSQVVYVGDCTKYNFCFANGGMVLSCRNGWFYNPNRKMCVPPDTYRCPWS